MLITRHLQSCDGSAGDDDEESAKEKELVNKLQELIRPFLLRRRLNNVILDLPPKRELIVYTVHQLTLAHLENKCDALLAHDSNRVPVISSQRNTQGLSSMQKKYYKWILTRDVNKLTKGTGGWGLRRGGNR